MWGEEYCNNCNDSLIMTYRGIYGSFFSLDERILLVYMFVFNICAYANALFIGWWVGEDSYTVQVPEASGFWNCRASPYLT